MGIMSSMLEWIHWHEHLYNLIFVKLIMFRVIRLGGISEASLHLSLKNIELMLMTDVKGNLCYLLSMRMSSELLSNWVTWTTSGQGFSVRTHTRTGINNNKNNSVKCELMVLCL